MEEEQGQEELEQPKVYGEEYFTEVPVGLGEGLTLFLLCRFYAFLTVLGGIVKTFFIPHLNLNTSYLYLYITAYALDLIYVGLEAAIIILTFLKNIFFRKLFVATAIFKVIYTVSLVLAAVTILGTEVSPGFWFYAECAFNGAWVVYLYSSIRVKNTFLGMRLGRDI